MVQNIVSRDFLMAYKASFLLKRKKSYSQFWNAEW